MSDEIRLRRTGIEWREVDGEMVALDLESSNYLAVNPTGTTLWPLLVEGATREALMQRLVEAFSVDESQAARDVDAFVEQLADVGILASRNGGE